MPSPTRVGAVSQDVGSTLIDLTYPSGILANDVGLMFIHHKSSSHPVTAPAGWVVVHSSANVGNTASITILARLFTGAVTGTVSVTTINSAEGCLVVYRDAQWDFGNQRYYYHGALSNSANSVIAGSKTLFYNVMQNAGTTPITAAGDITVESITWNNDSLPITGISAGFENVDVPQTRLTTDALETTLGTDSAMTVHEFTHTSPLVRADNSGAVAGVTCSAAISSLWIMLGVVLRYKPPPPAAPSGDIGLNRVEGHGNGRVQMQLSQTINMGYPAPLCEVQRSSDGVTGWTTVASGIVDGITSTSGIIPRVVDPTAVNGTRPFYRVKFTNDSGSITSAVVQCAATAPPNPVKYFQDFDHLADGTAVSTTSQDVDETKFVGVNPTVTIDTALRAPGTTGGSAEVALATQGAGFAWQRNSDYIPNSSANPPAKGWHPRHWEFFFRRSASSSTSLTKLCSFGRDADNGAYGELQMNPNTGALSTLTVTNGQVTNGVAFTTTVPAAQWVRFEIDLPPKVGEDGTINLFLDPLSDVPSETLVLPTRQGYWSQDDFSTLKQASYYSEGLGFSYSQVALAAGTLWHYDGVVVTDALESAAVVVPGPPPSVPQHIAKQTMRSANARSFDW